MILFLVIVFVIILISAILAIVILKNKTTKEENPTDDNNTQVEEKEDVSNITDSIVIEGVTRDMEVLSDSDAHNILSEMYIKAMDTYGFYFDTEDYDTQVRLVGYDDVMNNFFTSNGIKEFEEYYKDVLVKDGNYVYLTDTSKVKDDLDYDIKITDKNISSNKIEAKIECTYNDKTTEEQLFIIVKENDMWKVDSFVCPF